MELVFGRTTGYKLLQEMDHNNKLVIKELQKAPEQIQRACIRSSPVAMPPYHLLPSKEDIVQKILMKSRAASTFKRIKNIIKGVYHSLALSPFHGKDTQPMMPPSGRGRP
ncbi:hypothetical protein TNCV_2481521 [Trichonephila clavipes]|nr:hypothetical protein TNCV_2481521 [Trichonephila clavipes]